MPARALIAVGFGMIGVVCLLAGRTAETASVGFDQVTLPGPVVADQPRSWVSVGGAEFDGFKGIGQIEMPALGSAASFFDGGELGSPLARMVD